MLTHGNLKLSCKERSEFLAGHVNDVDMQGCNYRFFSLSINLLSISSFNRLTVWSIKCQKTNSNDQLSALLMINSLFKQVIIVNVYVCMYAEVYFPSMSSCLH